MDIFVSCRLLVVDQIATITWRVNRFSAPIADNSLYVIVARYLSRLVPDERGSKRRYSVDDSFHSSPPSLPAPCLFRPTLHDDRSQRFRKHVRHRAPRVTSACPDRSSSMAETSIWIDNATEEQTSVKEVNTSCDRIEVRQGRPS